MTTALIPPGEGDDHRECAAYLRNWFAAEGCEVTISTAPPLVKGPYTTDGFVCAHNVGHWLEPTGEQIAQWARDGVK